MLFVRLEAADSAPVSVARGGAARLAAAQAQEGGSVERRVGALLHDVARQPALETQTYRQRHTFAISDGVHV